MIKKLKLKSSSSTNMPKTEIEATNLTIFIGPNNSGKSRILNEIGHFCQTGQMRLEDLLLENIEFCSPDSISTQNKILNKIIKKDERLHYVTRNGGEKINPDEVINLLNNPNSNKNRFSQIILKNLLKLNGGENRLKLVGQGDAGSLLNEPKTNLQILMRYRQKREYIRKIIYDAFGEYLVIDPTQLGKINLRLSERPPNEESEEIGILHNSISFHSKAKLLNVYSDGVKAYTGLVLEIFVGEPEVIIIDEPEAFLHPALAYKLGKDIADLSNITNKRLFISTHSANFLMGCIQSGIPTNIIRLTYRNNKATSKLLPYHEISHLMKNPLLRTTKVLQGLFYEFVIVTEADTDRAFYQEINDRLLKYEPENGIPNCLFINAQNKQTTRIILKLLRQLGIPSVSIVDIDVIKEGGKVWQEYLSSGGFVDSEYNALSAYRLTIYNASKTQDIKKMDGIQALKPDIRETAENLIRLLNQYGLFVVKNGELESWLKDLNIPGHGSKWLISMFERMGDNPDSPDYLKPTNSDVWLFIKEIKNWLLNPEKKGFC